jgi:hypothetical protein
MRDLLEFKNIHKGEDIYVLASGKSVDFIDNTFFNNKIVIGVNQVYKKVECKYLLRKEQKYIKEIIDNNGKSIHFISFGDYGGNNTNNIKYIKQISYDKKDNIVLYPHIVNKHSIPQNLPDNDILVTSYSTITTAIHLAAYMGASNIILIGHDCGSINNECNFEGYHKTIAYLWAERKQPYVEWLKDIESHTIKLRGLIKNKYDCNIYSLNPFINFGLEGNIYTK